MVVIFFLLMLLVIILVHELGHFLAARLVGVGVEEFSVGFGKQLWSRSLGGVLYKVGVLPFGGYVRLVGESGECTDEKGSFASRSPLTRGFILISGSASNFLLGLLLLTGFYLGRGSSLPESLPKSLSVIEKTVSLQGHSLLALATGRSGFGSFTGPVGAAELTGKVWALAGFEGIILLAALLSVVVGMMNLLPLPALDGGRLLFVLLEAVRGKAVPDRVERIANVLGVMLIAWVMLYITFLDLLKLLLGK